ncbi:MAG: Crp/Fnr family transcriptional regulator [Desulfobulbaceae bacterium]
MPAATPDELTGLFPFLRRVGPSSMEGIIREGTVRTLPVASRIYWEGDACTHIAFVLDGEIRVFKTADSGREITLYEIGPGETCILNASCIFSGKGYPAEAVSLTEVRILLLPATIFRECVNTDEAFRSFVFSLLSDRLATMFALIEEVVFGNLEARLLEYLVEKSEDNVLRATHLAVANDLGTSREVVSRLLKDLERRGRVRLARNRITLVDQP